MSAQPARVIPLPHRPPQRPSLGVPLESFLLEGISPNSVMPEQCPTDETPLAQALEALERDEPVEAARRLAEIIQNEPANAEALVALGSIQQMHGDPVAAAESYRRASVADPIAWQPLYNRALLHEAEGNTAEAIALLYHAIALAPQEAAPKFRVALILGNDGRQSEARIWWKRTVAAVPSLTAAWLRLGLLELRSGRLADAATALQNAQGGEQEAADAGYHLALAHIAMGAPQEAYKALTETVRRVPSALDAHAALVVLALDSGDLEVAERHESTLRALGSTPSDLSLRMAQGWALKGEFELARGHYKRAVQSDSSMALGYFALTLEY